VCLCVCVWFIGKKFTVVDWVACVLMSIGLIFFTLADSSVSPSFSLYGNMNSFTILAVRCLKMLVETLQQIYHYMAYNYDFVSITFCFFDIVNWLAGMALPYLRGGQVVTPAQR